MAGCPPAQATRERQLTSKDSDSFSKGAASREDESRAPSFLQGGAEADAPRDAPPRNSSRDGPNGELRNQVVIGTSLAQQARSISNVERSMRELQLEVRSISELLQEVVDRMPLASPIEVDDELAAGVAPADELSEGQGENEEQAPGSV